MSNNKDIAGSFVLVSGMIRSGTTLVSRILGSHADIAIASDVLLPILKSIKSDCLKLNESPIKDGYFDNTIENFEFQKVIKQAINEEKFQDLASKIYKYLYMEDSLKSHVYSLDHSNYKNLIKDIVFKIKELSGGKKIIGVKEAYFDEFIPLMRHIFPSFKSIHIIRNPLAVYNSINGQNASYPLVYTLKFWRRHVDLALCNAINFPDSTLIIKYEDLIMNTKPILEKITDFMGQDFDVNMLNFESWKTLGGESWLHNSSNSHNKRRTGLYVSSLNKWKDNVSEEQMQLASLMCAPELSVYYPELNSDSKLFMNYESFLVASKSSDKDKLKFPTFLSPEYSNEDYYLVWSQETDRYEGYMQNTLLSEKDKIERFLSKEVYSFFMNIN
jgi:hypothetical protein